MLEALKANRCDYVRVLLDQGVQFNIEHLPELYEQVNAKKDEKDQFWIKIQIRINSCEKKHTQFYMPDSYNSLD